MKTHRAVVVLGVVASIVLALVAHRAGAVVNLATPQTFTAPSITPRSFTCELPPNDLAPAQCFIAYEFTDSTGAAIPNTRGGQAGPLTANDYNAFLTTAGNIRLRATAALQNNLALVGDAQ